MLWAIVRVEANTLVAGVSTLPSEERKVQHAFSGLKTDRLAQGAFSGEVVGRALAQVFWGLRPAAAALVRRAAFCVSCAGPRGAVGRALVWWICWLRWVLVGRWAALRGASEAGDRTVGSVVADAGLEGEGARSVGVELGAAFVGLFPEQVVRVMVVRRAGLVLGPGVAAVGAAGAGAGRSGGGRAVHGGEEVRWSPEIFVVALD